MKAIQASKNKLVYHLEPWSSREFSSLQHLVSTREMQRAESILLLLVFQPACVNHLPSRYLSCPICQLKEPLLYFNCYHVFKNFPTLHSGSWQLSWMDLMHLSLMPARRELEEGLRESPHKSSQWSRTYCHQWGRMELGVAVLTRIWGIYFSNTLCEDFGVGQVHVKCPHLENTLGLVKLVVF